MPASAGRRLESITAIVPTALVAGPNGRPIVVSCLESLVPAARGSQSAAGGARLAEIILVTQGRTLDDPIVEELAHAGVPVRQLDVLGPFNFSKKVNAGAAVATSDVLFLLNDDARLVSPGWPDILIGIFKDEQVGAIGPIILNPDGTLNSAGDALSRRVPRHIGPFDVRYRPGLAASLTADRDVSLITGAAFLVSRSTFQSIGGFDERYPSSYGDVDFCLRLRATGFRLVCTPHVTVVHRESTSRDPSVDPAALQRLIADYPDIVRDDPMLPPLVLPTRLRFARTFGMAVRSLYLGRLRGLIPWPVRAWLSRVADSRGWMGR